MKKILLITPSFNIGGIERNIQLFTNAFLNQGLKVDVVVLHSGKVFTNYDSRASIIIPKFIRGKSLYSRFLYRLRMPIFIRNSIKKSQPDAILSMADTFNGIVIMSSLGLDVKVFVGDVTKPDRNFPWSTKIMKNIFYPFSTGFFAQTNSAASYYNKKFKNKLNIKVIGPIVNKVNCKLNENREHIILNVGRLSIEKGQDRMIEIFSLVENKENWKLYFTADGPLKSKIENLIEKYGLVNNVHILGYVDDLNSLYCKASIFVLPSRLEGYPNALVEAMSAKLPCVTFNSFPVDEIIENKLDGFIIEDDNLLQFKDCLEMLMADELLRKKIGKNAQKKVENSTAESISHELLSFMESC